MSNRNARREGELIDQKFAYHYMPIKAHLDECDFNKITGKIEISQEIVEILDQSNHDWNYLASILNKRLKSIKAEFGAIKRKFQSEIAEKEMRMFFFAVSQELANWGLSSKDIDIEFIQRKKIEGMNPIEVAQFRILQISETIEPFPWFDWKHKHKWVVITDSISYIILCADCLKHYKRYSSEIKAIDQSNKLPKTNLGLLLRKLKF